MSGYFFGALLGIQVEPSLRQFLQKAESLDVNEHGTVGIETYADLLARLGRPLESMQFLVPENASRHATLWNCSFAP